MSDDQRIQQLLQEALESDISPEQVCTTLPELLPEVRRRWEQCRILEGELRNLFPSTPKESGRTQPFHARLPTVPGYEVESILGRGGMGVVYRARHIRLNRMVALKMLLSESGASEHDSARLLREAQAVAALKHAHIVQVHDVGELDGRPFFTMELVEGGTLADKLAGVPMSAAAAAAVLSILAQAVDAAHRAGIIHRDLKPSNVLLTEDGTPKISDFGLARKVEGEDALTASGARVGTPSYMAPEQAAGRHDRVGPRADVYALGAILYEMLTGRPPFRGESAAETERQLLTQEPVLPSRLNARVPRDLETISIKCLQKDPDRRYATAGALADDVGRFQRGEQIVARPAGIFERGIKWTRRHPAVTVSVAGGTLLAIVVMVVAFYTLSARSVRTRLVQEDLASVAAFEQKSAWSEAQSSLNRARARLGDAGPAALRNRIEQCDRNLQMVAELNAIRLERASASGLAVDFRQSYKRYSEVFRVAGLGALEGDPVAVGTRVKAMDVHMALIGALDDWLLCTHISGERKWLMQVARTADGSPADWRARVRDPEVWGDKAALAKLLKEITDGLAIHPGTTATSRTNASVTLLATLGAQSRSILGEQVAIPFLEQVQRAYPNDFWINLILGQALRHESRYAESSRYLQAAVSISPEVAFAHTDLGEVLSLDYRIDEALAQFREAAALKPNWLTPAFDAGTVLRNAGRYDEALASFREAVRLAPNTDTLRQVPEIVPMVSVVYSVFADACEHAGRHAEAIDNYRRAIAINSKNKDAHRRLREMYASMGQRDQLLRSWRDMLNADPDAPHEEWSGFAELELFLGDEDEYRRACQALLARFGSTSDFDIAERTGRACLLQPVSQDQLDRATALIDRAVASTSTGPRGHRPYFLLAKGLSEYRYGRMESAINYMKGEAGGVLAPAPSLVLAMAEQRMGRHSEALAILAGTATANDWSSERATSADHWIFHILRREAERLILPNLPAFLQGKYQPTENNERIAMTSTCQFKKRYAARARLWSDVLVAEPRWAGFVRSHIACTAAQVGCGLGDDADTVTDGERILWRNRAREWIRTEVAVADATLKEGASGRRRLLEALTRWSTSPEMVGVRDSACLEHLPADERAEWMETWKQVQGLLQRVQEIK